MGVPTSVVTAIAASPPAGAERLRMTVMDGQAQQAAPAGAAHSPNEALEKGFDRIADSLYRYFAVRTADAATADDLMQQLWVAAASSVRRPVGAEMEFWLRGIAANLIRTWFRVAKRRPPMLPIADPQLAASIEARLTTDDLPADALERQEEQDQLMLAITELPSADQEVLVGHYFEGRSLMELAAAGNCSPRAIEGRLYRARASLREKLRSL